MKSPASFPATLFPSPDPSGVWLAVAFPLSRSPALALALALAGGAHTLASSPGFRVASFLPSPAQAGVAASLLRVVGGWSGVVAVFGGVPLPPGASPLANLAGVLTCYAGSGSVAHCAAVVSSAFDDGLGSPPALVPCRYLLRVFPAPLSRLHPSSEPEQVAARAAAVGCAACPAFSAAGFRWI